MPPEPMPEFLDLNILPAQYLPQQVSSRTRLFGALAVVLTVLAVLGGLVWQRAAAEVKQYEAALPPKEQQLASLRTPAADFVALSEELRSVQAQIEAVEAVDPSAMARGRDWSRMVDYIKQYDPRTIKLNVIEEKTDALVIEGLGRTQDDILYYASQFDRSGLFERVQVESMQNSGEPFPTPFIPGPSVAVTPGQGTPLPGQTPGDATDPNAPTQPSATPVPQATRPPVAQPTQALYDAFEIDDTSPRSISVGLPQRHNFNPDTDVDRATFTGRAGRTYCIMAVPEADGVDPVIEAVVGGVSYSNDNCDPSILRACQCNVGGPTTAQVEVSISAAADQPVQITVTSKGTSGPGAYYSLRVYEAAGTSPASDGDAYEPDDAEPKPIALGENQSHTFHKAGDVDRVAFTATAGKQYQVQTSGLATGVDTTLSAVVDGFPVTDDNSGGGAASLIAVTPNADGIITVSVANKGSAVGANAYYTLALSEIVATPTPTVGATATDVAPTPTVDCADAFEPDDSTSAAMSAGQMQARTFCPSGDMDRVMFNATAGHLYRIETIGLTTGVDTVLSVTMGSQSATHDNRSDVSPVDLSSLIEILNSNSGDVPCYVTVTNKNANYGPEFKYILQVIDLGISDSYEPDDVNPRELMVGSPQRRTFFPDGDIDQVYFMASAGRSYRITTSGLSSGVDITCRVLVNGSEIVDDDPVDTASSVEFQNTRDNQVRVTAVFTNNGTHGPEQYYTISIEILGDGDTYEDDEPSGVPIDVGGYQFRTFYPEGDRDIIYFTAQAYHSYRIWTSNLAAGVDTHLAVGMGASTYLTNDDRSTSDVSSEVQLVNDTSSNQIASATITNKDTFATTSSYQIHVQDLGAGTGDAYEPDLTQKRYINVGDVQEHTFYPSGDTDQVFLPVQAGKRYAVLTCGSAALPSGNIASTVPFDPVGLNCSPLVPGVDPVIIVTGPIANCEPSGCMNDDATTDPSYTNARVEFEALSLGEATIKVYNYGTFSPGMVYYLRVHEVNASLTPTPSATPTATAGPTPTATQTSSIYPGPQTATPTITGIPSETPTPTETPIPTETATVTATATETLTVTPGPSPTPTLTPTLTETPVPSVTPTPTEDPYPVVWLSAMRGADAPSVDLRSDALRSWESVPRTVVAHQDILVEENAIAFVLVLSFKEQTP